MKTLIIGIIFSLCSISSAETWKPEGSVTKIETSPCMSTTLKLNKKIDSVLVDNEDVASAKLSRNKEVIVILGSKLKDNKPIATGMQIVEKKTGKVHLLKVTNRECRETDEVSQLIAIE